MSEAIEIANGGALEQTLVAPAPHDEFAAKLQSTIDRCQRALLALQRPEGYWQAPLEANGEMNAEYIIFNRFMGVSDPEMDVKLKRHLLDLQQPDGSWNLFPGGEGDLSTSIEAYFAGVAMFSGCASPAIQWSKPGSSMGIISSYESNRRRTVVM